MANTLRLPIAPAPRRGMTALVRLLLLTLLVTGGSAPRAAVQAPLPSPEGFPADGQPPIVRLLSPGAEPRTPLRYQLDAGQTGRMTMRMDMSIAMDMGGMAMPAVPSPTIVMESDIAVTEVAESGDVSFEITMTEAGVEETPGVDPGMASAMQGMLQGSLKGMRGSGTVSSRGISRAMTFDLGEAADPQMQQAFGSMSSSVEQMSTPLPEEPVGVGARWEVLQRMDHSGAVTFQTLLLEVTAIDGPRVTLAVKADQQAPRQSMSNPGLPPEAVMTLQRLSGSGTGTMTIDLTALVPTSEMSTKSNAVMDVSMAGTSQTMGVETTMTMTIAPGGG